MSDLRYTVRRLRNGKWASFERAEGKLRWRRIGPFGVPSWGEWDSPLDARWFCNVCRRTDR